MVGVGWLVEVGWLVGLGWLVEVVRMDDFGRWEERNRQGGCWLDEV